MVSYHHLASYRFMSQTSFSVTQTKFPDLSDLSELDGDSRPQVGLGCTVQQFSHIFSARHKRFTIAFRRGLKNGMLLSIHERDIVFMNDTYTVYN